MNSIEAAILGIIQGITELLPISSSAHLEIIPKLFKFSNPSTTFDITTHIGSFFAIIIGMFKPIKEIGIEEIKNIKKGISYSLKNSLLFKIGVCSIPTAIAAFTLQDKVEQITDNSVIIAIALILLGVVFLFFPKLERKENIEEITKVRWKNTLFIGIGQCLSLIRGVSRSGITITSGVISGLKQNAAVKISFLFSIIIMLGLTLKDAKDIISGELVESFGILFIGFITSFVSSLVAIKVMFSTIKHKSFFWFGVYRILLGIIILIVL